MNIYLTLDYELFFGPKSGSVEQCIIKPTEALLKIVDPYAIKITCFVDAGYLIQLEHHQKAFPQLQQDYQKITQQIRTLSENGHGIELHIHPHWEDSYYDGKQWIFDTARYKLADFSSEEILDIVNRYTAVLARIAGKPPKAFRAGGWSAQPFENIQKALAANQVFIDSTVFPNGFYNSEEQCYDFRNVPQYKTHYHFSTDLTAEDSEGKFTEIPISSYRVSPLFFWKFAFHKILKQKKHQAFGDGVAIAKTKKDTLRLMLSPSNSVVSVDGYKASFIKKAFLAYKKNTHNKGNFVMIGHPKAFTPYSLIKTAQFIKETQKEHKFKTFQ